MDTTTKIKKLENISSELTELFKATKNDTFIAVMDNINNKIYDNIETLKLQNNSNLDNN